MQHWILLTAPHYSETVIWPGGDTYEYRVSPNNELKKGDTVYLWWNPNSTLYGWGEVAEHPRIVIEENENVRRQRQLVVVERKSGFDPRITLRMMQTDSNLRKLIPAGHDDMYALPLRPAQAYYINDYIREHKLDAPQGSATVKWSYEDVSDITLQTLLTLGDKTDEGRLVEGIRIPWRVMLEIISQDPNEIYNMDPRKLEELIAGAYFEEGYEVELTPRSGDRGRDVVAIMRGIGSIRIFDQVKRYKISSPVTAEEVRALVGVISSHGNVSKGIITTTSVFAPTLLDDPDIRRLVPYRLDLRPRDKLLPWLESLRRR